MSDFRYAFRFASLQRPNERVYTVHDSTLDLWDDNRYALTDGWAGVYSTYGDGMVQHSGEYKAPREHFMDYLGSLAAHLLEHFGDAEHLRINWPSKYNLDSIQFALSVQYKDDGKRRYYSTQERKISTSENKRFDKRWFEVEQWANGTTESAYRMLLPEFRTDLISQYALYSEIRDANSHNGKHPTSFFKIGTSGDEYRTDLPASQAFETVDLIVSSFRSLEHARSSFGCYCHNAGVNKTDSAAEAS